MTQLKTEERWWPYLAAVAVFILFVAGISWSLAHPYAVHWDEAGYFNNVHVDVERLHEGNLLRLGGRILIKSYGRPPAFRLLALPVLGVFGFHIAIARAVSLAWFVLSCWFVYLAATSFASKVAGAFAVLIFALSPEVVSASIFFGTDTPLYLATAAMLYYLFVLWGDWPGRTSDWICLGLAIGLGLLSKSSFVMIGGPAMAFALIAAYRQRRSLTGVVPLIKAGILGGLIAAPWWIFNLKASMAYAQYARSFVRNSLGSPSLATWGRWLNTVLQCLLGHGVSILIALIVIACVAIIVQGHKILDPVHKFALGACASAGLPIVLLQLSGTNHLLRHITPSIIPVAIVAGILADRTGWAHSRAGLAVSGLLFCVQLGMLLAPVIFPNEHPVDLGFPNGALPWRTMVRFDQWDWTPVRKLSEQCGLDIPRISYLGNAREFNPPAIVYPWLDRPGFDPEAQWLWRYEDGPINWQKVMDTAHQSDIVLTTPLDRGEYEYKEDLDNAHDAEFDDRLSRDPQFQGPVRFMMGRFEPVEVDVYVKRAYACHLGPQAVATKQ